MNKVRFGLIGFSQGYYATTYTRHISKFKEVDVVACCDLGQSLDYVKECAGISAEQFCDEIGAQLIHDIEAFLDLELDAVMIATEVWEHAKYTMMSLKRGWHVFVGKPLSIEPDEIEEIIQLSQSKDLIVVPGNPLLFETGIEQVRSRVMNGEIGTPTNLRLFVHHEAMIHQQWERDSKKSGGPLGTFGVYLIDTVRRLTGQNISELFALGDTFVYPEINAYDTIQISAKTTGGMLASLNLVSTITWDFPFVLLDIVGTKGTIRTNYDNYSYILQGENTTQLGGIRYSPMGNLEIEHFIDCCQGRSKPRMSIFDMLAVSRNLKAVQKSLVTGNKVNVT